MDLGQEINFGDTAAVLAVYPPEWAEGIPSVATARVFAGTIADAGTAEFTPVVTVDSVNLSTAAASQASGQAQTLRRRLYLAVTTGLTVGRWYLLTNNFSQTELVQVVAVSTNAYVDLRDPLAYDYAVSAACTIKGIRLTAPVDATWVATLAKVLVADQASYRVLWQYTVAGVVRRHYTEVRLVAEARRHNVTPADLQPYYPDLRLNEPTDSRGQQAWEAIEAGYRRVRVDIRTRCRPYRVEMMRDPELLDDLVRAAALAVAASWATPAGWSPPEWAAHTLAQYDQAFAQMLAAGEVVFIDVGVTGAVTQKTSGTFWLG